MRALGFTLLYAPGRFLVGEFFGSMPNAVRRVEVLTRF
jgi:hypothetical protein